MKKAIVVASASGQTKKLAAAISEVVSDAVSYDKLAPEALEADVVFVGSWTMAFTCPPNVKTYLESLNNKKVFIYMTAGYGDSADFLNPIMDSVKGHINDSNEIIGSFICQGEVSPAKQAAIKDMDLAKYEAMKPNLDKSVGCPTQDSIAALKAAVSALAL